MYNKINLNEAIQIGPWRVARKHLLFVVLFSLCMIAFGVFILLTHVLDNKNTDGDEEEDYEEDDEEERPYGQLQRFSTGDWVVVAIMISAGIMAVGAMMVCLMVKRNAPHRISSPCQRTASIYSVQFNNADLKSTTYSGNQSTTEPYPSQTYSAPEAIPSQTYAAPQSIPSQTFAAPQSIPSQTFAAPQSIPSQTFAAPEPIPSETYSESEPLPSQSFSDPDSVTYSATEPQQLWSTGVVQMPQPTVSHNSNYTTSQQPEENTVQITFSNVPSQAANDLSSTAHPQVESPPPPYSP